MNEPQYKLPTSVVGRTEVNRLIRELIAIESFISQSAQRKTGQAVKAPRTSYLLQQLASDNKLSLFEKDHRASLASMLQQVIKKAPQVIVSFASEPQPVVTDVIVGWLRYNIHPMTLVQIGLQPSIGAGCVLKTPNSTFDMSLRKYLGGQRNYLAELLHEAAIAQHKP